MVIKIYSIKHWLTQCRFCN